MFGLPPSSTSSRATDRRPTSRQPNTASTSVSAPEHGCIAKHVGDDEEAYVGAADVDLIEVAYTTVARGYGDVFELDVHVVFGYNGGERGSEKGLAIWDLLRGSRWAEKDGRGRGMVFEKDSERTFKQLAAICLTRSDF
jgi:hypothetical protein